MLARACMYTQNIRTLFMKKTTYSNSQAKVVSLSTAREKVQINGESTLMTALVQSWNRRLQQTTTSYLHQCTPQVSIQHSRTQRTRVAYGPTSQVKEQKMVLDTFKISLAVVTRLVRAPLSQRPMEMARIDSFKISWLRVVSHQLPLMVSTFLRMPRMSQVSIQVHH